MDAEAPCPAVAVPPTAATERMQIGPVRSSKVSGPSVRPRICPTPLENMSGVENEPPPGSGPTEAPPAPYQSFFSSLVLSFLRYSTPPLTPNTSALAEPPPDVLKDQGVLTVNKSLMTFLKISPTVATFASWPELTLYLSVWLKCLGIV